jgi:hypothetical protein
MEVTKPVPNFLINLSLNRLDIIVPPDIIIETIPAYEMGTFIFGYIDGQAEPRSESGSPRLIKAK